MKQYTNKQEIAVLSGIFLLFISLIWLNTQTLWFIADIENPHETVAQVFYTQDSIWRENTSVQQPIKIGFNRLAISLPSTGIQKIRFDPGQTSGLYRITNIRWIRAGISKNININHIQTLHPETVILQPAGKILQFTALDEDPQLIIPAPPRTWLWITQFFPLLVVISILIAIHTRLRKTRLDLPAAAIGMICITFFLYSYYCILFGSSGPTLDDWRYMLPGPLGLVEGKFDWLFWAGNDTYFLTGQLFDFFILKISNFNFHLVRFFALFLLAIYLWINIIIIKLSCISKPIVAAIVIFLNSFIFVTNNYWGIQSIAYHQFLPILFSSLLILLIIRYEEIGLSKTKITAIILYSLAAGFAYISGALLLIALGIAVIITYFERIESSLSKTKFHIGLIITAVGVFCLIFQVVLVSKAQGSLLLNNHAVTSVYPAEIRFWVYFIGLFGRAFGYTGYSILIDIILTSIALLPGGILVFFRIKNSMKSYLYAIKPELLLLVFFAWFASIIYALTVSFGRAGFSPVDGPLSLVSVVVKSRFHFWWISAMLPYCWLGWVILANHIGKNRASTGIVLTTSIACVILIPKSVLPWDYIPGFLQTSIVQARGINCIATHIETARRGTQVKCPDTLGFTSDASVFIKNWDGAGYQFFEEIKTKKMSPNK